jgi:hypothetical protein
MVRGSALAVAGLLAAGCVESPEPASSFYRAPAPTTLPPLDPASLDAAARVDSLGRKLLAANPEIGARPLFRTVGAPQPEVFHRGTTDVFVTEGLVKQCSTDGQLAGVLATELGKLVRDREVLTPEDVRKPAPLPPIDSRFGNDDRMGGTTDRADYKQWVDYEVERRQHRRPGTAEYEAEARRVRRPMPLPDPNALAMSYLQKAGFTPNDLIAARGVMDAAAANSVLERQITGPVPGADRRAGISAVESAPPPPPSGPAPPSP